MVKRKILEGLNVLRALGRIGGTNGSTKTGRLGDLVRLVRFRPLPWEYGVRNLLRRPTRTLLTLVALTIVVLLTFIVVGFIRGLEASLAISGDADVVLVYSLGARGDLENSAIPARTAGLLAASLKGIETTAGVKSVSPELYVAVQLAAEDRQPSLGLIRGVTSTTPLVRRRTRIVDGHWPGAGEVLVGRLAHAKLGYAPEDLATGKRIVVDGRSWRVCGHFTSQGAAFESELWFPLADLQQVMKRQDLSLVALRVTPDARPGAIDLFCTERIDLELQSLREIDYYAALEDHFAMVRGVGWAVVLLVAAAGAFAGLNTMHGAVVGRTRELAMLQAIGFRRRAIVLSLVQEAALLSAAASLLAGWLALLLVNGVAVRFTMGAFALRVDGPAILIGCGLGLSLGVFGAIPPAIRAMRLPVAENLKAL